MWAHLKISYLTSCGTALASGVSTFFGYIPAVAGTFASLAAVAWIYVQYRWAKNDRKEQGKK